MIMVNYYKTIEQKGVFSMEDTSKNKKDKLNEKPLNAACKATLPCHTLADPSYL